MTGIEQKILTELCRGDQASLVIPTATTVDVGRWFRNGRVWAACLPGRLALFATGERPYGEEIAVADLDKSFYNFLTGELALAPATAAKLRRLKLSPLDAQQILEQIHRKEVSHA